MQLMRHHLRSNIRFGGKTLTDPILATAKEMRISSLIVTTPQFQLWKVHFVESLSLI